MRLDERREISAIQAHLEAVRSGVDLDANSVPGPGHPGEHSCYRGRLDSEDASKLVLWWEFEKCTCEGNCTLEGLPPCAACWKGVKQFVCGNAKLPPLDLRSASNLELVVVTKDEQSDWLYIIDGNHRAIAQAIRGIPFKDVPIYVCMHPAMDKWAYIPRYYKKLWGVG